MEFFHRVTQIDFMGQRRITMVMSAVLLTLSIGSLVIRGLHFGIDFTGGTVIEIGFPQPAKLNLVRETLNRAGYTEAVVQNFGTTKEVLIRIAPRKGVSQSKLGNEVMAALDAATKEKLQLRRVEFVGPQVGQQLAEDGGLALVIALGGILVYVWFRFEYRFALGAIIATLHDIIITVGFFSLTHMEFDLTVLAAVLAVMGYSLNDTIVVFDRIRENFRRMRKGTPEEVINTAVNQTLSRTIMTSLATLLVVLSLLFLGGELIFGFAVALTVGIIVGTYSSIYIASLAALLLGVSKADLMPVRKDDLGLDARP